jgi:HSP20 family protein
MVDLVKWKPFRGLFHDFFEDFSPFFRDQRPLIRDDIDFLPKLDIKSTETELEVTVDLPGIDKKDLEVNIEDGVLTIKGEKKGEKREEKDGYTYYERHLGRFERRVHLPEDVDESSLRAEYKDGVLRLTALRRELEKPEPKKIEIQ